MGEHSKRKRVTGSFYYKKHIAELEDDVAALETELSILREVCAGQTGVICAALHRILDECADAG